MSPLKASASIAAVLIASASTIAFQQHASARDKRAAIAESLTDGDVLTGSRLYTSFGCGACHALSGRGLPQGRAGPDLSGFSSRAYIAGRLPNSPNNLMHWIADPRIVDPETAMPDLGVTTMEARHLAAYLLSEE